MDRMGGTACTTSRIPQPRRATAAFRLPAWPTGTPRGMPARAPLAACASATTLEWPRRRPLLRRLRGLPAVRIGSPRERLIVQLVLVGVALGEVGDRPVELVARTQVGGDGDRVAGAGMGPGQGPAADAGIEAEAGRDHRLDLDRALHVAQLAPVEVTADVDALGPAQEDVAGGLHHPLPSNHPLAVLLVAALGQRALQDRRGRLLDLQEQRVLLVAALEQGDEGPGADTAHPDHLAGHIDQLEPLQQLAPIILQGGPVGAELGMEAALDLLRRTGRRWLPGPAPGPRSAAD